MPSVVRKIRKLRPKKYMGLGGPTKQRADYRKTSALGRRTRKNLAHSHKFERTLRKHYNAGSGAKGAASAGPSSTHIFKTYKSRR